MSLCKKPQTILIVDDEPALLHTMSALLQREGYRCIAAKHPAEALSICESDEVIDFVVSDFSMPAMNGLQLWERIRQVRSGLNVLFVTGNAEVCELLHARGLAYLSKPFPLAELVWAVHRLLAPVKDELGA